MKKNKTEVQILDECIADIDKGFWVCGRLTENPTGGATGSPNEKPLGCAIGLVGINSGAAQFLPERDGYDATWVMNYASDYEDKDFSKWTPEARNVVEYLAETSHSDKTKEEYENRTDVRKTLREEWIVIETNDNYCQTPAIARKWFVRARDLAISKAANSDEQ